MYETADKEVYFSVFNNTNDKLEGQFIVIFHSQKVKRQRVSFFNPFRPNLPFGVKRKPLTTIR